MPTHMCPMSWWFPVFLFMLLPAAASGFSVQGVTLRVCSEICSDGSCAPCSHGTEMSQTGLVSTDASSGHQHDLPASRLMTLTLSLKRSGSEQAVLRSPRQVPNTELSSSGERPGPDKMLTSFGHQPQLDTKETSMDSNAQSGTGQTPVTMTTTPTGINAGDFATNVHSPGEFSFGFLEHHSEFHDITTSGMRNDVSLENSKDTRQDTSPHPGAVETGWEDFLDIAPAEAKTEKDSAPNEKLELPETATKDTPLERTSPASLSASRTESSAERARMTGRMVLPDDLKKNLLTVPLHGGLPHPHPSGEEPASSEGEVSTTGQPVTDPGTTTSTVLVSHRPPEKEDSERTAEKGGGRTEGGGEGQGQLHAEQVVLLVAPVVGALLSVIGAVCVARSALANRYQRQKLITDMRNQQNQTNQDQPEYELHTTQLGAEENARNDHGLY